MQKKFLLRIIVGIMAFSLLTFGSITPTADAAAAGGAPDYSQKASWCKLPNIISKDVDTFYIYSTTYMESSFQEGAPDYAPLDNPEMLELAQEECFRLLDHRKERSNGRQGKERQQQSGHQPS